ncbi:hypothetical protein J6590_086240 [Homalodisca vitripennis]|nr:hypothetical protein J6590_086240 [Homalodisca vitripennis]
MEHRHLGDDEPDGEGWVAVPGQGGVVKEVKERTVKSREEKEERLETEDVQHLGDISDEYRIAISSITVKFPPGAVTCRWVGKVSGCRDCLKMAAVERREARCSVCGRVSALQSAVRPTITETNQLEDCIATYVRTKAKPGWYALHRSQKKEKPIPFEALLCPSSWTTDLCEDLIKQSKGESRYSKRLMVLIKSAMITDRT